MARIRSAALAWTYSFSVRSRCGMTSLKESCVSVKAVTPARLQARETAARAMMVESPLASTTRSNSSLDSSTSFSNIEALPLYTLKHEFTI